MWLNNFKMTDSKPILCKWASRMLPEDKEKFIRQKSREHFHLTNEKIMWSLHAVKKLRIEELKRSWVEESLKDCTIVEDYSMEGRHLPGCLVLGYYDTLPIHAVIAIDRDSDIIFIITIYKPSRKRWTNEWKTRKAKA